MSLPRRRISRTISGPALSVAALAAFAGMLSACAGETKTVGRGGSAQWPPASAIAERQNTPRTTTATRAPEPAAPASGPVDPSDPVAVSRVRERALEVLGKAVDQGSPEERANGIEGLTQVPSRLPPVLRRALFDQNPGVRAVASMAIARLRIASLADEVRPLLSDPSPMVQSAAIWAMAANGQPVDQSPLAGMLRQAEPRLRAQAAFIMGEIGNRSAVGPLKDAASSPLPRANPAEVRLMSLQIAEALVKLGEEDAVHEIRAALYPSRPEDLEATALACQILGQVRDRPSTSQLVYLTAWNERQEGRMPAEVRLAAAGALAKLGNPRGGFIADEFARSDQPTLRAQSALVYGETGRFEHLPALSVLVNDTNRLVQISAATAILKIVEGDTGARTGVR